MTTLLSKNILVQPKLQRTYGIHKYKHAINEIQNSLIDEKCILIGEYYNSKNILKQQNYIYKHNNIFYEDIMFYDNNECIDIITTKLHYID